MVSKEHLDLSTRPNMSEPPSNAIWEKLGSETPKAYSAFLTYRNMPASRRSIRNAVKELYGDILSSKVRQFQTWSARYAWVARSGAWDEEVDRVEREEQINAVREMRKRQAKIAQAMQQKAVERLRTMQAAELTVADVLSFLTSGFRMEAGALGEPQEIQRVSNVLLNMNVDYTTMKDEDLRSIIARNVSDKSFPMPPKPIETGIDEASNDEKEPKHGDPSTP